jgi:hypothetical protein
LAFFSVRKFNLKKIHFFQMTTRAQMDLRFFHFWNESQIKEVIKRIQRDYTLAFAGSGTLAAADTHCHQRVTPHCAEVHAAP